MAVLLGLALAAGGAAAKTEDSARPDAITGTWRIEDRGDRDPDRVQLELKREYSNATTHRTVSNSFDIRRDELAGIRASDWSASRAEVSFDLAREPGRLHLEGTLRRGDGLGEYTFEPDGRFQDELDRAGFHDVGAEDLLRLAIHDVRRDWVRGFEGRGLAIDDLLRFKTHDITPAYVRAMRAGGYRDATGEDLVRLKTHGVDAEYLRALGDLGYDRPSVDDVIRLKARGVDPAYVREMQSLVSPRPTVDDVIRMRARGVDPSYARDFRGAGYDRLSPEDLIRLKAHDVSPAEARRARSRDHEVSVDELIRLKSRGEL